MKGTHFRQATFGKSPPQDHLSPYSGRPAVKLAQACSSDAPVDVTESELIKRVLNGEVGLFSVLYGPCRQQMLRAAFVVLGNWADAEDAAQEAVIKAIRALAGFRQEAKFGTWLIQIAINEARGILRKSRRYPVQSIEARIGPKGDKAIALDIADERATASEVLLRDERDHLLAKAMRTLPPAYLSVLQLRDIEGLNTKETAKILGLTVVNVKTRLSRARRLMREAFNKSLGLPAYPSTRQAAGGSPGLLPDNARAATSLEP